MPDTIPDRQLNLLGWYIRYHGLGHPKDMGPGEIHAFLSYLNNERH